MKLNNKSEFTTKLSYAQEVAEQLIDSSLPKPKNIFVAMPFNQRFTDFYMLGVRPVAIESGLTCTRADEDQFNGSIREEIITMIRKADVVVVEVSDPNLNVYYELGWAHALEKPTILCTTNIELSPFDIKGLNHIVYTTVFELKKKFRKRLTNVLGN
ncbi:nucleoside 2-deoxyribosyltransferase [Fretibacter rubidus]|uniref:nucleoside 2-deoxyribosyltransferase n=1 Tax=Fretibacter rubidus TaxID=570162 RepID=UPI00352A9892